MDNEEMEETLIAQSEEIERLEEDKKELENHIQDLERENAVMERKIGISRDGEDPTEKIISLERDNDELRERVDDVEKQMTGLKDENLEKSSELQVLREQNAELEENLSKRTNKLETLEKEYLAFKDEMRNKIKSTDEAKKKSRDAQKEHVEMYAQLERLTDENKEVNTLYQDEKNRREELETVLTHKQDAIHDLEAFKDSSEAEKEDLRAKADEYLRMYEVSIEELGAAADADGILRTEIEELKEKHTEELTSLQKKITTLTDEKNKLNDDINHLKETTTVGAKTREIERLTAENNTNKLLAEKLREELQETADDNETLGQKLLEYEENLQIKLSERSYKLQEESRKTSAQNQLLEQKLKDEQLRINQIEANLDEANREIEFLGNWKSAYEKEKGIVEMAKQQKKMKEDNRRYLMALEQMNNQLGEAREQNELVNQRWERLKMDAGKPADFDYDIGELKAELLGDNAKLKAQVIQLEDQVDNLEEVAINLRKTLKNQAGAITSDGFKYQGLSAEKLVLVNTYASNLRDGLVEAPLNDRSAELLRKNKRLQEEIEILKVAKVERELASSMSGQQQPATPSGDAATPAGTTTRPIDSDALAGLRQELSKIVNENKELKSRITGMQDEIVAMIRKQGSISGGARFDSDGGGTNSDALAAMVVANTDAMKKELLQELKKSQQIAQSMATPLLAAPPGAAVGELHAQPQQSEILRVTEHGNTMTSPGPRGVPATPMSKAPTDVATSYPNTPYMPHANASFDAMQHSQFAQTGGFGVTLAQPATPHGRALLSKTLANMNLPPEEWATEVKELNGQLIECLEQLSEREQECEEQKSTVSTLEDNLIAIKQQMASLYHDFSDRLTTWEMKEKDLKSENDTLRNEADDLRLKVRKYSEFNDAINSGGTQRLEALVNETGRKLIMHEVNESILTRKYNSLLNQLQQEQDRRHQCETDVSEIEATLKKRILYLEQYKAASGGRIAKLQGKLNTSVPQSDYSAIVLELDALREDHLNALNRELEARITSLHTAEQVQELQFLKHKMLQSSNEVDMEKARCLKLQGEIDTFREYIAKLTNSGDLNMEMNSMVTELARCRGDASRLQTELDSARKQCVQFEAKAEDAFHTSQDSIAKAKEMEKRCETAEQRFREMKKIKMDTELKFDGGATRSEADDYRRRVETLNRDLEETKLELNRQREIAEIASAQAESISSLKEQRLDEVKELREYCNKLESRSDDELLIGKLQRQLMTTKTAYKGFIRKYQTLRGNMRQRELAVRLLENQLDQREKAIFLMQQTHRVEIGALKKALTKVDEVISGSDMKDKIPDAEDIVKKVDPLLSFNFSHSDNRVNIENSASLARRLLEMSSKIGSLASLAQDAVTRTSIREEEARRLRGDLQDRTAEVELLRQRCEDLVVVASKDSPNSQRLATRLVTLGDQVKTYKLSSLQQKREISILRQEKRHYQGLLTSLQENMIGLEEGKVTAEAKQLLGDIAGVPTTFDGISAPTRVNITEDFKSLEKNIKGADNMSNSMTAEQLRVLKASMGVEAHGVAVDLDNHSILQKLETKSEEYIALRKEFSVVNSEKESLVDENARLQSLLSEMQQGGTVKFSSQLKTAVTHTVDPSKMSQANIQELQEGYQVKMQHMKALLDDKKKEIDGLRRHIDDLTSKISRGESAADKRANELLQRFDVEDAQTGRSTRQSHGADESKYMGAVGNDLMKAHEIIDDKQREVDQLNQRIIMESNKRERAELRCETSLKEMESMKADLYTLANKLQESEERLAEVSRPSKLVGDHTNDKVANLQKLVKAKEEKIRGYRAIIIRLKDEFIKSEEDKAHLVALEKDKNKKSDAPSRGDGTNVSPEKLDELRAQVASLMEGLRQTKEDLQVARSARENYAKARQAAIAESERLEEQVGRAESTASAAQEALTRCRKDLEDSRKRELKLRDKLKEVIASGGSSKNSRDTKNDSSTNDGTVTRSQVEQMQRELDVLRAQNIALREAVEKNKKTSGAATDGFSDSFSRKSHESFGKTAPVSSVNANSSGFTSGGNVLGGADVQPRDELRTQLRDKYESEKKLQNRVKTLEKRLKEKLEENEELQHAVRKARDAAQSEMKAKDEATKRANNAMKSSAANRKLNVAEVGEIEGARERVFELEEEVASLSRRCEVEFPSEISRLRSQVSSLRDRLAEAESELTESESARKRVQSRSGTGSDNLRDSEDRYMKAEKLKEDLEKARRQRLDLEAALLDRDSRAMENQFDIAAKDQELDRLKRRLSEVDTAYKVLAKSVPTDGTSGSSRFGDKKDGGKPTSARREKELEGVVEAMKKVVDKLKAENDRLRKTGAPGERRMGELEKQAASEKKRAEKFNEEIRALKERVKSSEETSTKLSQRQQQLVQIRKQLKAKEDELTDARGQLVAEREIAEDSKRKCSRLELKVQQLETELGKASSSLSSTTADIRKAERGGDRSDITLQKKAIDQAAEIETLKSQLVDAKKDLTNARNDRAESSTGKPSTASLSGAAVAGADLGKLRDAYQKVVKENDRLRRELSAFDMDFFEEIENLKFSYAEAQRKLRAYES